MPTCDNCDDPVEADNLMMVRVPRPSDPSDMCCVLWGCAMCFPHSEGSCMTEHAWDVWIESPEAVKAGRFWLT